MKPSIIYLTVWEPKLADVNKTVHTEQWTNTKSRNGNAW